MSIPKISGAFNEDPPQIQENEKVVGVEKVPGDMQAILQNQPNIYNTNNNNNVLSTDNDQPIINALKAYITGTVIKVDWFHQISNNGTDNTNFSTVSFLSNSVNSSYLQIVNMEIKLRENIVFTYDQDENVSTYNGTGLMYPGFIPKIGDMFIYNVDQGKYGLFKISETPERLSISTLSANVIKFTLIKILTQEDKDKLLERVRETSYFNKQRFLSENCALLKHQEVLDLEYITKSIDKLTQHYGLKFVRESENSIFRPDDIYDPYIVEFIRKVVGCYINRIFITQLYPMFSEKEEWYRSLYSKLLDRDNIPDMINKASYQQVTFNGMSGIINSLINRYIVVLEEEGDIDYISSNILSIDTEGYTPFDRVVSLLLAHGVVSYEVLKTIVDTVRQKDLITQFYQIPILIYILKLVKSGILSGKNIQYVKEDISPYISINFTTQEYFDENNEDTPYWKSMKIIEDNIITIDTNGGKILGVITDSNDILYLRETDITYIETIADIDISYVLQEKNIDTLSGVWRVVLTNSLFN